MKSKYALFMTVICAISAGCTTAPKVGGMASAGTTQQSSAKDEDAGDELISATSPAPQLRVVFADRCPSDKDRRAFSPIVLSAAGYVLGQVVGNTIDTISKSLSSTQAITFSDAARLDGFALAQNGEVFSSGASKCMIVVVGSHFGGALPENTKLLPGRTLDDDVTRRIVTATKLSGPALFYLEARVRFNNQEAGARASSAFTYEPQLFYYPNFIAPNTWRYTSKRDVLLKVEFARPGQATPFASFDWLWSGVQSGGVSEESVKAGLLPWSPIPDGLEAAAADAKALGERVSIYPVNVKASLTETAKPRVLLKYLGDALAAQKDNIVSEVTSTLNQSVSSEARATARLAAATEVGKKYEEYISAYDEASKAYAAIWTAGANQALQKKNRAAARIAFAKLSATESLTRAAFRTADIAFNPLPSIGSADDASQQEVGAAEKKLEREQAAAAAARLAAEAEKERQQSPSKSR